MARRVFFSFHYERDAWRAGQVRNCNLLQIEDQYGFIDSVDWQSLEVQGRAAIERWIADQLDHTSVTVVLIGAETGARPWVRHEIVESKARANVVECVVTDSGLHDDKRRRDAIQTGEDGGRASPAG